MNIEQVKRFLEGTTKCGKACGSEVFQLQDKGCMVLLPTSLEEESEGKVGRGLVSGMKMLDISDR